MNPNVMRPILTGGLYPNSIQEYFNKSPAGNIGTGPNDLTVTYVLIDNFEYSESCLRITKRIQTKNLLTVSKTSSGGG